MIGTRDVLSLVIVLLRNFEVLILQLHFNQVLEAMLVNWRVLFIRIHVLRFLGQGALNFGLLLPPYLLPQLQNLLILLLYD